MDILYLICDIHAPLTTAGMIRNIWKYTRLSVGLYAGLLKVHHWSSPMGCPTIHCLCWKHHAWWLLVKLMSMGPRPSYMPPYDIVGFYLSGCFSGTVYVAYTLCHNAMAVFYCRPKIRIWHISIIKMSSVRTKYIFITYKHSLHIENYMLQIKVFQEHIL